MAIPSSIGKAPPLLVGRERELGILRDHLTAALAEACAAPYEKALTLLALAALRDVAGERPRALSLLAEARDICTALDASPALAKADALAATFAASSAPRAPLTSPAGLTGRQVEVLRLVAAGRTDREIAEALSLSERTVSNHVSHILARTNAENRTEAAAFALRHGLA